MGYSLGTAWQVNELFVKEHTFVIVSEVVHEGETKFGLQKYDLEGEMIKGLVLATPRQMRQVFLPIEGATYDHPKR
ncbi:hypothetical protein D3C81_1566600 [compost metagenome]